MNRVVTHMTHTEKSEEKKCPRIREWTGFKPCDRLKSVLCGEISNFICTLQNLFQPIFLLTNTCNQYNFFKFQYLFHSYLSKTFYLPTSTNLFEYFFFLFFLTFFSFLLNNCVAVQTLRTKKNLMFFCTNGQTPFIVDLNYGRKKIYPDSHIRTMIMNLLKWKKIYTSSLRIHIL